MAIECEDCGMEFETSDQLANHKKKFCLGAQGSEEAIEKRLEELKRLEHDIDYSFDAARVNAAPVSGPVAAGGPPAGSAAVSQPSQLQSPTSA